MLFGLVPVAHAFCSPGSGNINLSDCLLLAGKTSGGGIRVSFAYNNPADLVKIVTNNLFAISGVIFFLMIVLAGWNFIAKGKDGVESAKKIMTTAVIGFVVMFAAYWIVQIISVLTGGGIPGVDTP